MAGTTHSWAESEYRIIFSGRTVFYPGSGLDGQPVKLFSSTHFSHAFVYVDYGIDRCKIETELMDPDHGFKGYRLLDNISLSPRYLTPEGWVSHLYTSELRKVHYLFSNITPYAFLQVFERSSAYDHTHGLLRIAILFIGGDGIATYDALYCQGGRNPPSALIIQDHGFGGGYARFDNDGLLHKIADCTKQFPEYLLVGKNSEEWPRYFCVDDSDVVFGGMNCTARRLFMKNDKVTHHSSINDI